MLLPIHPVLLHLCPLLIVGCFLISFRHWLQARGYQVFLVYLSLSGLAILTGGATQGLAINAHGLLSKICIPAFYGLLYVSFEVSRSLRTPYRAVPQYHRPPKWRQLVGGLLGSCVGGVTGASLGALLGLLLVLVAPLLTSDLGWQMTQAEQRLIEWSMVLFGLLGILLGLLTGWGRVNFKRFGDRLLIGLTIQSFLITAGIRRLLGRRGGGGMGR